MLILIVVINENELSEIVSQYNMTTYHSNHNLIYMLEKSIVYRLCMTNFDCSWKQ